MLPRDFLVRFGCALFGLSVFAGAGFAGGWPTACHLPLVAGQVRCAASSMLGVFEVIVRVGGHGDGLDAPVDANLATGRGDLFRFNFNYKRRVPMTKGVLVDANRGRFGRKITGPDDRDDDPFRELEA